MHIGPDLGIEQVFTTATFGTFPGPPAQQINHLRHEKSSDRSRIRQVGLASPHLLIQLLCGRETTRAAGARFGWAMERAAACVLRGQASRANDGPPDRPGVKTLSNAPLNPKTEADRTGRPRPFALNGARKPSPDGPAAMTARTPAPQPARPAEPARPAKPPAR